jgi:hypothetical protein
MPCEHMVPTRWAHAAGLLLQVRTLFAGLAIKPGGVHTVVGPEAATVSAAGLPMMAAGCIFVEFASPGDALKALVRSPVAASIAGHQCAMCC